MLWMMRKLFCWLILLTCWGSEALGQNFSYVYIQGDKKVPIYVKVEEMMLPRLGKNYALISQLAPGPMHIEVLFQQNEYEPASFHILVPENGKRAFVISRKDNQTLLFDVEQNFYLKSGNDISEDHLPTVLNNSKLAETTQTNTAVAIEATPDKTIVSGTHTETNNTTGSVKTTGTPADKQGLQFIDNITFNNENNTAATAEIPAGNSSPENTGIINSDCSKAISALSFSRLKNVLLSRKTEDERLGLILEASKNNCFETTQAGELIETLDTDLARFSALKKLYPKITDQSKYSSLEYLLSTDEWKTYFQRIVGQP